MVLVITITPGIMFTIIPGLLPGALVCIIAHGQAGDFLLVSVTAGSMSVLAAIGVLQGIATDTGMAITGGTIMVTGMVIAGDMLPVQERVIIPPAGAMPERLPIMFTETGAMGLPQPGPGTVRVSPVQPITRQGPEQDRLVPLTREEHKIAATPMTGLPTGPRPGLPTSQTMFTATAMEMYNAAITMATGRNDQETTGKTAPVATSK